MQDTNGNRNAYAIHKWEQKEMQRQMQMQREIQMQYTNDNIISLLNTIQM